jgi:hypothetical protein
MPATTKKTLIFSILFSLSLFFSSEVSAASLTFSPATRTVRAGDTGTIKVVLDTQGKSVYGIEAYITVSGNSGEVVTFSNPTVAGNVSADELIDRSFSNSQITFSIIKPSTVITGTQEIVSIPYTAKNNGTITLAFKTNDNFESTIVAEDTTGENILTNPGGATLTVSSSASGSSNNNNDDDDDTTTTTTSNNTTNVGAVGDGTTDLTNQSTMGAVPSTGGYDSLYLLIVASSLVSAALIIKKAFIRI